MICETINAALGEMINADIFTSSFQNPRRRSKDSDKDFPWF